MIIADENLHQLFVNDLLIEGFEVISVRQIQVGMDDRNVAQWVLDNNAVLITEDKDFGALLFERGLKSMGVLLMRCGELTVEQRIERIRDIWSVVEANPTGCMIVATPHNVRVRRFGDADSP